MPAQRILLLSVDGMHAFDLARYVKQNPGSSFAALVGSGVNYTTASCARPADSFPGMMAIATGGSPVSTGVYFDLSYDRSLWPPTITSGPTGTIVAFNETIDFNRFGIVGITIDREVAGTDERFRSPFERKLVASQRQLER